MSNDTNNQKPSATDSTPPPKPPTQERPGGQPTMVINEGLIKSPKRKI